MYAPKKILMETAIEEAKLNNKKYSKVGEFAIGAVIVLDGKVIAKSGNRYNVDKDPTGHAEMAAMRMACKKLRNKHLRECILYTTNEPCPMCATAAVVAEMKGIVYGANIEDMRKHWMDKGETDKQYNRVDISCDELIKRSNPKLFLIKEFMRKECKELFLLY